MGWTFAIIYCVICFTACVFMVRAAWGMRKDSKAYQKQLEQLRENTLAMRNAANTIANYGNKRER
jgi:hypothetical protein